MTYSSLADELADCFDKSLARLTASQRARVDKDFAPGHPDGPHWDEMSVRERQRRAQAWDRRNRPMTAAELRRVQKHSDDLGATAAEVTYWNSRSDITASDAAIKETRLKPLLKKLERLDAQHKVLRGDSPPFGASSAPAGVPSAAVNWKMTIQIEAARRWNALRTAGANPTVHSIVPEIAKWCRDTGVTTVGKINPSERYIREHVLGGKHWTPPT